MIRWCCLFLLLLSCEQVKRVELRFASAEALGLGPVPLGFNCVRRDNQAPLLARAVTPGGDPQLYDLSMAIVVDFIRLQGQPSCRPSSLLSWCCENDCRPIETKRRCIPINLADLDPRTETLSDRFAQALAGTRLTEDAPDEPVLVRVVGLADTCCEEPLPSNLGNQMLNRLVGCAVSCPTILTAQSGAVLLDTLALENSCTDDFVRVCAQLDFQDGSTFSEAVCEIAQRG